METRKLGGLDVSIVGLGCNNFGSACDQKQTSAVVGAALDAGINFFDTADVYGNTLSESYLGAALGSRRDEAVIATKFGNVLEEPAGEGTKPVPDSGGASPRWIARAIEGSLKRLGTDRIDLYQLHIPAGDVPIEETLGALDGLVREGKVLEIGCSNFSGEQIDESVAVSESKGITRWASAQNHYNLLARHVEQDAIPACRRHNLAMLPYFPLASGFLTGKYQRGQTPSDDVRLGRVPPHRAAHYLNDQMFEVVEKLGSFAAERGYSLLELAVSWLAAQPAVASVIAGATKPEQVKSNSVAAKWELSKEDVAAVDSITRPA